MAEEKRVKTKIKPDICPLCKKPTEVVGIGVYECNSCKNKWFEEGLILEERYVEAYGKSEELLVKLQEKDKEVKKEEKKEEKKEVKKKDGEREEWLSGRTREINTGCGSLFVILNHTEDNKINEVFLISSPSGGCGTSLLNGIGISLSFYLQQGGDIRRYIRKLAGTHCPRARVGGKSCPEALIQAIKEELAYLKGADKSDTKEKEEKDDKEVILVKGETCPDCNNLLVMQEGCKVCKSCGWSECS